MLYVNGTLQASTRQRLSAGIRGLERDGGDRVGVRVGRFRYRKRKPFACAPYVRLFLLHANRSRITRRQQYEERGLPCAVLAAYRHVEVLRNVAHDGCCVVVVAHSVVESSVGAKAAVVLPPQ